MRTRIVRNIKTTTMSTQRLIRFFDLGAAQLASGFVQAGVNMAGQAINARAQKEENQKNRDFQMLENARARKWQEDMFNKYQSSQAQVQQRMQAGLNPYAEGAVTSQSVGSASTHSLPAGIAPSFGNALTEGAAAMIAGMNSYSQRKLQREQAEYTKAQTISEYQDQILKRLETAKNLDVLDAEIKLKQEQARGSGLTADIARVELSWLEDLKAKGINPNEDTHNESVQRVLESQAKTLTENLSRLPRIAQIKAKTSLDQLAYDLDNKYGRVIMKGQAQEAGIAVRKANAELSEYLAGSDFRIRMLKAGANEAEVEALVASYESLLSKLDYQYLRDLIGTEFGDEITDPYAMIIYALANFDGIGVKLFGNSKN